MTDYTTARKPKGMRSRRRRVRCPRCGRLGKLSRYIGKDAGTASVIHADRPLGPFTEVTDSCFFRQWPPAEGGAE